MPARTVHIRIFNATNFTLEKIKGDDGTLCHGVFTEPFSFPPTIEPGHDGLWQAESGGSIPILGSVATGTEGWVKYRAKGVEDTVLIYWDNPFQGGTFFGFKASAQDDLDPKKASSEGGFDAACGDDHLDTGGSTFTGPKRLDFFALHQGVLNGKLVGLTQGDLNDGGPVISTNFVPGEVAEHAWFEIGVYELASASMRLTAKALNLDAAVGFRRSLAPGISFTVKGLLAA